MKNKVLSIILTGALFGGLLSPIVAESFNEEISNTEIIEDNTLEEEQNLEIDLEEEVLGETSEQKNIAEDLDSELFYEKESLEIENEVSSLDDGSNVFNPNDWNIDFSNPEYAILESFKLTNQDVIFIPGQFDFESEGIRQIALNKRQILSNKAKEIIIAEEDGVKVKALGNSMYGYFMDDMKTEVMDLRGLDTSEIKEFDSIFLRTSKLKTVNVSGWDTSSAESMENLFRLSNNIVELDLESWDMTNVKSIKDAFNQMDNLETVHFSTWNFTKLEDMSNLFLYAPKVKNIDMSMWNTSTVKKMYSVFWGTHNLESLDIKNWDVSSVEYMDHMFYDMRIKHLDLSGWDVSNVKSMRSTFGASSLETLKLTEWKPLSLESLDSTFSYNKYLKEIDSSVSTWDVSGVTTMYMTFAGLPLIESLDLSLWDVQKVEEFDGMFLSNPNLKILNLEHWKLKNNASLNKFLDHRDGWNSPLIDISRIIITNDSQILEIDSDSIKNNPLEIATFNAHTLNDNGVLYGEFPDSEFSKDYTMNQVFYSSKEAVDLEIKSFINNNIPVDSRVGSDAKFADFKNDNGHAENFVNRFVEYGKESFDARWTNAILDYDANTTDLTLTGNIPDRVEFLKGTAVSVSGNPGNLKRLGYELKGWSLVSNPTSTDSIYGPDLDQTALITLNESATLYAVWSGHPQSINWHFNNEEPSIQTTQKTGEVITIPPTPIKEGYTFVGWFTDVSLTTKIPDMMPAYDQNVELHYYAKYEKDIEPEPENPEKVKPDKEKLTDEKSDFNTPSTGIENNQLFLVSILLGVLLLTSLRVFSKKM